MTDIDVIDDVRAFNRFYTNKLGLLAKGYLDTAYALTEARILYELGARQYISATELNRELGLDPAYLSRVLKKFRQTGLIDSVPDPADGRSQTLHVTSTGQAESERLGELSRQQLAGELQHLDEAGTQDLVRSMQTIRRLFDREAAASPVVLRPHRIGDMGWIIERQSVAYTHEYAWNGMFEALVAEVAGKFIAHFNPQREYCWIAERDGERLGSVLVADGGGPVAKLRLLYLEPQARGLGLGRRLVDECVQFARASGYRTLALWTNDNLTAAIHIYRSAGFKLVAEEKHQLFGPACIGQTWELDLSALPKSNCPQDHVSNGAIRQ
ncbi:MarR family transcriptional regulator [Neorhizobium lilium]|uniref:MarR family transcriptional regulator n=1 Tax=Neorhizobium lilium TaxID=2503024 RepID=A0A444LHE3_9HYPH|nr:helix-turn-helix domain-containing GNAT family N-acetyltransferase [Neorhizobium lilium]RWX78428.1 MarR family transcriptional regulator [Neorhizobium lilium]